MLGGLVVHSLEAAEQIDFSRAMEMISAASMQDVLVEDYLKSPGLYSGSHTRYTDTALMLFQKSIGRRLQNLTLANTK